MQRKAQYVLRRIISSTSSGAYSCVETFTLGTSDSPQVVLYEQFGFTEGWALRLPLASAVKKLSIASNSSIVKGLYTNTFVSLIDT
jgi:hypothetical protein